jgi:hypothetical protein
MTHAVEVKTIRPFHCGNHYNLTFYLTAETFNEIAFYKQDRLILTVECNCVSIFTYTGNVEQIGYTYEAINIAFDPT